MTVSTESVKYLAYVGWGLYSEIYDELGKVEEFKQHDIHLRVEGYDLMIESDHLSFDYRVSWEPNMYNPETKGYELAIRILPTAADGVESDMSHIVYDIASMIKYMKRLEFQFEEWGFLYVTGVF